MSNWKIVLSAAKSEPVKRKRSSQEHKRGTDVKRMRIAASSGSESQKHPEETPRGKNTTNVDDASADYTGPATDFRNASHQQHDTSMEDAMSPRNDTGEISLISSQSEADLDSSVLIIAEINAERTPCITISDDSEISFEAQRSYRQPWPPRDFWKTLFRRQNQSASSGYSHDSFELPSLNTTAANDEGDSHGNSSVLIVAEINAGLTNHSQNQSDSTDHSHNNSELLSISATVPKEEADSIDISRQENIHSSTQRNDSCDSTDSILLSWQ